MDGINVFDIKHKFDIDFDEKYSEIIEKYINISLSGFLIYRGDDRYDLMNPNLKP